MTAAAIRCLALIAILHCLQQGYGLEIPTKRNLAESVYWGKRADSASRILPIEPESQVETDNESDESNHLEDDISEPVEKSVDLGQSGEKETPDFFNHGNQPTEEEDEPTIKEKRTRFSIRPWKTSLFRRLHFLYRPMEKSVQNKKPINNVKVGANKKRLLFVPWQSTWHDLLRDVVDTPEYKQQVINHRNSFHKPLSLVLMKRGLLNNSLWKYYLNKTKSIRSPKRYLPENYAVDADDHEPIPGNFPFKTPIRSYVKFKPSSIALGNMANCNPMAKLLETACQYLLVSGDTEMFRRFCPYGLPHHSLFRSTCDSRDTKRQDDSLSHSTAEVDKKYRLSEIKSNLISDLLAHTEVRRFSNSPEGQNFRNIFVRI